MNPATMLGMFGLTLHSDADRHRRASWSIPVTLRLAAPSDRAALERLAGLDSSPLAPGPHLVAVREDEIEAAISLRDHRVLANPFRRTAESCELLRCLAGGLAVESGAASFEEAPAPRLVLKERCA
jgi:hypothetical protein